MWSSTGSCSPDPSCGRRGHLREGWYPDATPPFLVLWASRQSGTQQGTPFHQSNKARRGRETAGKTQVSDLQTPDLGVTPHTWACAQTDRLLKEGLPSGVSPRGLGPLGAVPEAIDLGPPGHLSFSPNQIISGDSYLLMLWT